MPFAVLGTLGNAKVEVSLVFIVIRCMS
jgi:hypothetical protein